MSKITAQLSIYPDYLHQQMGFDFSEKFHLDPEYRNEQWKAVVRWVRSRFGHWGCGLQDPTDSYSVTTLAPVHLTPTLFGSPVVYFPDRFPDVHDYPLASIPSLWDFNWVASEVRERIALLMDEAKRLVDRYGPEEVGLPYYAGSEGGMIDLEATHCPLTISYRLFGERLLYELYDDPDAVQFVFARVLDLTLDLAEQFREIVGQPEPGAVCFGACAATFLNPTHFTDFLAPQALRYASGRPMYFHSCGKVNHLLGSFAQMDAQSEIKVFDCREQADIDIAAASKAFPNATISYMMSPPKCLTRSADEMKAAVRRVAGEVGENPLHLILNLPVGTPDFIVDAFFDACVELGADLPDEAGFGFA